MSGWQLVAVLAAVVACAALAGVGVLVAQVRRLRGTIESRVQQQPPPVETLPARVQPTPAEERPVLELRPLTPPDEQPTPPSQQQVVAATLSHPLVRASALSYGLRNALRPENRDRVLSLVRREVRRRQKVRRRAARRAARVVPLSALREQPGRKRAS